MTTTLAPANRATAPRNSARAAAARARLAARRRAIANGCLIASCIGLGVVTGFAVIAESWSALRAPGGLLTAFGRAAGLWGSYGMLVMLVLMARVPGIERAVGQDRLARWHRRLGPWPICLITAHVVLITFGYAEAAQVGFWRQTWTFLNSYPDVLASAVGFGLIILVGVASISYLRRRLRYETWWVLHLYLYLALALSFSHQLANGGSFLRHPFERIVWSSMWALSVGLLVVFRFGLPLWRSLRHGLRVSAVREESPGVISLVCSGRAIDRLKVEGGQFFQWRFLERGLWWQAHPYSLSALPSPPYLRVTVRTDGDHGRSLSELRPGTRVMIEGPYGTFTAQRRRSERVLLVGAGVGVTPIRAMLEELPPDVDATVIVRATSMEQSVLREEIANLAHLRGSPIHEILGDRDQVRFDARMLRRLVPDIAHRDVFVCGPDAFSEQFAANARRLGVPRERIHHEAFAF